MDVSTIKQFAIDIEAKWDIERDKAIEWNGRITNALADGAFVGINLEGELAEIPDWDCMNDVYRDYEWIRHADIIVNSSDEQIQSFLNEVFGGIFSK